jgi:hypothetical protein
MVQLVHHQHQKFLGGLGVRGYKLWIDQQPRLRQALNGGRWYAFSFDDV